MERRRSGKERKKEGEKFSIGEKGIFSGHCRDGDVWANGPTSGPLVRRSVRGKRSRPWPGFSRKSPRERRRGEGAEGGERVSPSCPFFSPHGRTTVTCKTRASM